MDILQESRDSGRKNFFNHVFATTDEHNAEFFNGFQYAILGVIPIVALNKLIQRFIPEADTDKSGLEILVEIFIQLLVMIGGVIIIHRAITFIPTYSGFKYDNLAITNAILLFLVIILSIQTKIGIKINIILDRLCELWHGDSEGKKMNIKKRVKFGGDITSSGSHSPSQADHIDANTSSGFPPMPVVQTRSAPPANQSSQSDDFGSSYGPMPANALLGSSFNSF
jgi:hypothetical protein